MMSGLKRGNRDKNIVTAELCVKLISRQVPIINILFNFVIYTGRLVPFINIQDQTFSKVKLYLEE